MTGPRFANLTRLRVRIGLAAAIWGVLSLTANGELRIVSYNPTGRRDAGIDIVLKSIGEELRNGFAKPIDVLLLQEQNRPSQLPGPNAPSTDTQGSSRC